MPTESSFHGQSKGEYKADLSGLGIEFSEDEAKKDQVSGVSVERKRVRKKRKKGRGDGRPPTRERSSSSSIVRDGSPGIVEEEKQVSLEKLKPVEEEKKKHHHVNKQAHVDIDGLKNALEEALNKSTEN